ncbi:hypothetical protein [Chondromyces crocatus]|uniref:Uncharacterized protein n=1 Tax=Chondromyces crocatus TaxID=52 RepID=A0A0K1ENV3_CHOCO|nr:hypothetical protein [Chondromyces crocatus]AKT42504.1 uncharacterized protein CMC5_067300 [Chondromyces crocatus]
MRAGPPEVLEATPGVPYVKVPLRWDLPGGDEIRITPEKSSATFSLRLDGTEVRFEIAYAREPESRLLCATEPEGPGVPRTHFGCWTPPEAPRPLRFWMAPGVDCPPRHVDATKTLTTPMCWNGELDVEDQTLWLRHAIVDSLRAPVGYVSWLGRDGQLLLAADIVREMQIEVFDPMRQPLANPSLRRQLVLLTVALHWWEHTTQD